MNLINVCYYRESNQSTQSNLISKIISAGINPKPNGSFGNISYTLTHGKESYEKIYCAFIDESEAGGTSTFSTEGCSVVEANEGRTKCTCNHMTSFAVVAKISKKNPVSTFVHYDYVIFSTQSHDCLVAVA